MAKRDGIKIEVGQKLGERFPGRQMLTLETCLVWGFLLLLLQVLHKTRERAG